MHRISKLLLIATLALSAIAVGAPQDGDGKPKKSTPQEELAREYAGRPWADSPKIVTAHYNIHCNSTAENAKRYADVMEALYKAYDKVFPETYFPRNRPEGKARNEVYIHANHQQFMDWTGSPPGVGGFFYPHPKLRTVTAYHGSFGTSGSTEEVLAHEGTHQFQAMIFPNMMVVPIWVIEGMACYFGDGSEIERNKVEINVIPRDRLIGLQAAIEDGSYCTIPRLLRLPQGAFTGFHYGHGWGVFYWCLYGNKASPKAWSGNTGHDIMNDWLLYCRDIEGQRPDPEKHASYFESLITEHTGQTVSEWEQEYKDWILKLKTDPIIKKKGAGWTSEKLGFECGKPSGWKKLKDSKLFRNEAIAFSTGSKKDGRRISTLAMSNWQHGALSEELANRMIQQYFAAEEWKSEFTKTNVGGFDAMDGTFVGTRVKADAGGIGADDKGDGEATKLTVRVLLYATYDKIYANVVESSANLFEKDNAAFDKYVTKFQIIF